MILYYYIVRPTDIGTRDAIYNMRSSAAPDSVVAYSHVGPSGAKRVSFLLLLFSAVTRNTIMI